MIVLTRISRNDVRESAAYEAGHMTKWWNAYNHACRFSEYCESCNDIYQLNNTTRGCSSSK